ncbi:MAG TPA: hypothetical protein PKD24_06275 [Pyrinomonadaceae bacterium]|nr:hypothetical protein [Pyrinomonadaceae bacterium]HMP65237.1 hypothetical protein [Pyrinomonadaceae bacterium]
MNKLKINKVGVLSLAKIYGVMFFVIGLLIGVVYGLIIIVYSLFGAGLIGGDAALAIGGAGVIGGIVAMIFFPIFYGIMGFIGGAIGALLYNIFAKMVGGIEIEVQSVA